MMSGVFSDVALSRRLERAEGHACAMYAESREGSEWKNFGGVYAMFNGIDSVVTQSFGLGLFEDLTVPSLHAIERFFQLRGAAVVQEVSPFAGVAALGLLCERRYRPVEISNVLCRASTGDFGENGVARVASPEDAGLWADVMSRGWGAPVESGPLPKDSVRFLAGVDGETGAAAALCLHDGVALFGGAATVPELRCRGLQTALIEKRLRYAANHGCDIAMIVTEPGSASQRNAERHGFRVAYTRTKWRLG